MIIDPSRYSRYIVEHPKRNYKSWFYWFYSFSTFFTNRLADLESINSARTIWFYSPLLFNSVLNKPVRSHNDWISL